MTDFKTHPSENPAERGKPAGWGTLKFRYAVRSLEPPLGRFLQTSEMPVDPTGFRKVSQGSRSLEGEPKTLTTEDTQKHGGKPFSAFR
jgi:hypothetical protein